LVNEQKWRKNFRIVDSYTRKLCPKTDLNSGVLRSQ